ncbi:MAG TPA: DUF6580 family putative transport protein [Ignavibacteriaceae bacterium]|nr:DUF6580 family putative transport protein [Ignavibacteriaceae bacterium]
MKNLLTPRTFLLVGLILMAAIVRLLPHPPNFAPITAMALFGGAYFSNKKLSFIVPLVALVLTDVVLGFHYLVPAVYVSFMMIVMVGLMLKNNVKFGTVMAASLASSILFFVVTNFAEWAFGIMYPKTALGLAECFTMAIPFFHNTLLGDLLFTGVMFGAFELAKVKFPKLAEVKA